MQRVGNALHSYVLCRPVGVTHLIDELEESGRWRRGE